MTEKNLIELVQMTYPDLGETLIKHELRKGEREFASKTYCLWTTFSDWTSSTDLSTVTPEFYAIKRIHFLDTNDDALGTRYRITDDTIYYSDDRVVSLEGEYYYLPSTTWTSDEPTIPAQFQEALAYYVKKKAATLKKDPEARVYHAEWKEAIKEAKKLRNVDGNMGQVRFNNGPLMWPLN